MYTTALSGGRALGIYLNPGQAGPNGLHGTFTDAAGRGLDLARAPIVTATGPAGRPTLLAVLLEGPGHFYTDGDFAPGEWNLQIVATTRAGEVLHTQFTVRL